MDYKSIIDNLTGEITTQQLKEKGLNDYYIKKAIEDNLIERISRGKYKIIKKEEYIFFDKFFMLIMSEKFQEAYDLLICTMKERYNSRYETHNRIYILLLEEILEVKESYLKEKEYDLKSTEKIHTDYSFYKYFVYFQRAVEERNFTEAYYNMILYGKAERHKKGATKTSTKLFSKLINSIYKKSQTKKRPKKEVKEQTQPEIEISNEKLNEILYNKFFEKFQEKLLENNLDESLTYLNEAYEYAKEEKKEKIKQLIELIETYINVTKNNLILEEKNVDYKEISQNYEAIFNRALENQDYLIAFCNIGACLRRDSKNEFLKIYQKVLFQMYQTNKQNIKQQEQSKLQVISSITEVATTQEEQPLQEVITEVEVEVALEEQSSQENSDVFKIEPNTQGQTPQKNITEPEGEFVTEEQSFQENSIVSKIETDTEEQLSILSGLDESSENINELLNELAEKREYNTLKELMEELIDKEQDILVKREYLNIRNILNDIKHLKNSRTLSKISSDYKEIGYTSKWCFYQARKNRDYKEAYDYLIDCDKSEIKFYDIYKYLIEDILTLEINNEKQKEIDKYIFGIKNKSADFLKENLEKFETLLREKIKNSEYYPGILTYYDNLSCSFEEYTLYLIEILKKVSEQKLDNNSFNIFDNYDKDIVTNFFTALQQGDYIKASEFIFSENWEEKTRNFPNKNYLILYKKLLAKITKQLDIQTKKTIKPTKETEILENETLNNLAQMKTLIKRNRDFIGVKQIYEKEKFEFLDEFELKQLNLASSIQVSDILLLFYKYQNAYKQGDLKKASTYLQEYKEAITKTSLDRCLDHHFKRIETLTQEIDKPNFVKRENLYDLGLYLFENKKYEECIKVLNEHINLEPSLSGKAYLLRGKANEYLSLYEEAESDYLNAINISDSPDAYLWLGNIYLSKNTKEEALNLFLEYEKRRPNMDINNIENIYNLYQTSGDSVQTKKYAKILKYMKNNLQ